MVWQWFFLGGLDLLLFINEVREVSFLLQLFLVITFRWIRWIFNHSFLLPCLITLWWFNSELSHIFISLQRSLLSEEWSHIANALGPWGEQFLPSKAYDAWLKAFLDSGDALGRCLADWLWLVSRGLRLDSFGQCGVGWQRCGCLSSLIVY